VKDPLEKREIKPSVEINWKIREINVLRCCLG